MSTDKLAPDSPSSSSEEEKPSSPIDIPYEPGKDTRQFEEAKIRAMTEVASEQIDELMGLFTKGFDPGMFDREVLACLPNLSANIFPGSYKHLLVILLLDCGEIEKIQMALETWLNARYRTQEIPTLSETSMVDVTYFVSEIEMLRKLVAPLRGDTSVPIYWVNTRRKDSSIVYKQLAASVEVIEQFKKDIMTALESDDENRSMYTDLPVSTERTSILSIRQHRLDACKATADWDGFPKTDLEASSFHQLYKAYVCENMPDRARSSGWLPPMAPDIPDSSSAKAEQGDLCVWPSEQHNSGFLSLLLKLAIWLSVARGQAAVHLYCDIARHFTAHRPSKSAREPYICFLRQLSQIRVSNNGVMSRMQTPVHLRLGDPQLSNADYFMDVWRSNFVVAQGLEEEVSLLKKKDEPNQGFQLSDPPASRSEFQHPDDCTTVPSRLNVPRPSLLVQTDDPVLRLREEALIDDQASLPI
ncbi:hypothetical protein BDW42DRAFT_196120 [Aspergillus taichungensis]|uniref:Uncharacterized protein n=1 Tax=Aspergillus taichungensis TaxID=482145 RepID=A0A2J5HLT3_9EURO|nr:hypothetical protein BDW42DRAFT_196120 [Aspergillus taichungensis]